MRIANILPIFSLVALFLTGCGDDSAQPDPTGGGAGTGTGGSGAGGSGSGGEGGDGSGAGGGAPLGEPIVAPNEAWTWVPFEDALCANGEPTGIGVNLSDQSKNVVIFMMGGGACWNNLTCYQFPTASNLDGYQDAEFQGDAQGFLMTSLFDRNDPENPFRDYSLVFVPYCTGDVHAGTKVTEYDGKPTSHVGYNNVTAYLKRLVPTFPDAERIFLSGSSAGGFGAGINWWRVQEAFPAARVDLVDDSGPALPDPYLTTSLANTWRAAWGLDAALPADCAECATKLDGIFSYYGTKITNQRAALVSYTRDTVISQFFQISLDSFETGLDLLTTTRLDGQASFRYFYKEGEDHVLLGDPEISQNGVVLKQWLRQMVEDDPAWANVKP